MEIIRVGVDLAKNVYQVHGVDRKDEPVWRRQLNRQDWLAAIVKKVEAGNEIGIEACAGAIGNNGGSAKVSYAEPIPKSSHRPIAVHPCG